MKTILSFILSALFLLLISTNAQDLVERSVQTYSSKGIINPVLSDSSDLPTGLWSAGSSGGPVSFGVNHESSIYFAQGSFFFKAEEGDENIETLEQNFLPKVAKSFKINGDNLYIIFDEYSEFKNKIAKMTMSDLSSSSATEFGSITNGINKFEEIDGYVFLAHNKDGTLNDKIVGQDLLNNVQTDFTYTQDFRDFVVNGNYAYLIADNGTTTRTIEVVDFSNKSNVQKVGEVVVTSAVSLNYADGYLYVACADDQGIKVIDVSTPTAPTNVGNYRSGETFASYEQVFIEGTRAYARRSRELTVLDISTPESPVKLSSNYLHDLSTGFQITDVANGKVYYVDGGHFGIIETDTWVRLGQEYLSPTTVQKVKTDGTNLVISDYSKYYFGSLSDNKFSPDIFNSLPISVYPEDFSIDGDYFYITDYNDLYIHQVSNLSSTPLATYSYGGQYSALKVDGNLAVVGGFMPNFDDFFEIIDLTDKSNPTQLYSGTDLIDGTIESIEFSSNKNRLYLTVTRMNGKIWFLIYNITDKSAPVKISEQEVAVGKDTKMEITDSTAVIIINKWTGFDYNAHLYAYDISDPATVVFTTDTQISSNEYNDAQFLEGLLLVNVPQDEKLYTYTFIGSNGSLIAGEILDLNFQLLNITGFVDHSPPPGADKYNDSIMDDNEGYEYGYVYGSGESEGYKIIYFKKKKKVVTKVTLQTNVLPTEAATDGCSVSPSGGEYDKGTALAMKGTASDGWVWDKWTGDMSGSANPSELIMDADKSVTGNFKPILTIGFGSESAKNIAPPKEDEKIYIGTTNLTAGGVDWELHALKYIPLAKIKPQYTKAYLLYNGNVKEGSFTVDGDGYISEINFSITQVIAEGQTLSLKYYYMFTFPQNEKGTLAPLEEVKKLGISIKRTQVSCDPVPSVEGVKIPQDTFTSNFQTIGWIWNVSLSPQEPFVTFQDAIDDSRTLSGHKINVMEGYYKYEKEIEITKSLSFLAVDNVANTIIEVTDTEPNKGSVTNSAESVTIDGFTILGNEEDFGIFSTSDISIKNSIIRDCGKAAVFLNGNGILTINQCKIWSNNGDGLAFSSGDWENKSYYLKIEGMETEIISNTGNGIKSFGGDIKIYGESNQIHSNGGWGIKSMLGDIYIDDNAITSIHDNEEGGIITPNDARIPADFIIENNGGLGLAVMGSSYLVLENIKVRNNKGVGIGFMYSDWDGEDKTPHLILKGSYNEIINNKGTGIESKGGNVLISGTGTEIHDNTGWGIKSFHGDVIVEDNAMTSISNNGAGGLLTANDARIPAGFIIENNGGLGLAVMGSGYLELENIKVRNNGGVGIGFMYSDWDGEDETPHLILKGSNNEIINNEGAGIESKGGNILISGSGTNIYGNTGWGIRSNHGAIEIGNGAMESISSNGKGGVASLSKGKIKLPRDFIIENNGGPGIMILDDEPISFWDIKVRDNKDHGLVTMSKNLYIWGGSEFTNNSGHGIYSRFSGNVTISGSDISISNNHKWGVVVENGNGDIQGTAQSRIELNNNVDGGIWIQNGKLKSRNINVLSNFGDGIRCAKSTFVGQAKICSNSGKGIVSGGITTLEQVNICENEVTGVYITPTISYADLAIEISGNEGPINVNENIVYNIIITNNGPDLARGVMMKNPLPVGLTFVKVSSLNGESYEQDGIVYCDIGTLTNGSSINVELTTSASNSGTFINSASVESGMIDNEKNNDIVSITTVVTSPLSASLLDYDTDMQNQFINKSNFQESSTHLSYIADYIKNHPIVYSQVEDDEFTESSISGSIIEGNKNGGILYDSEPEFIIDNSNMIDNSPYGLKNNIPSTIITATNNYWGNSTGPSVGSGISNGIVGSVNFIDWLDEKAALTVSAEVDTLLISKGMIDTVYCFFQNWENLNDVVNVNITESANWISSSKNFSLSLSDSMGTSSSIVINTPTDITSGEFNQIYVTGISQSDPLETKTDSFFVTIFEPVVSTIVLSPDSAVIAMGDTLQFVGVVKDQFGNILEPNLVWEASSSIINTDGLFIADSSEGVVVISVTDVETQVRAETSVLIKSSKRILAGIIVNPDSLTIMPNHDFFFKAKGFDEDGFTIQFEAIWSANGGVIDSLGYFVASESLGYFTIEVSDTSGNVKGYSFIEITFPTNIEEENSIPKEYSLNQNYPNPFNPSTTISYGLPFESKVKVEIFNMLGQRVDVISNGVESAGLHSTLWDATHLASGVYIIRINATSNSSNTNFSKSMKMLLMK